MSAINILVVDDSVYMRGMLKSIINAQSDMAITGSFSSGDEALESLQQARPDIILISIDVAEMADLALVERLMQARHTPVIILSDQVMRPDPVNKRAIELGVVGFASKPKVSNTLSGYDGALCDIIRTASGSSLFKSPPSVVTAKGKSANGTLAPLNRPLVSSGKLLVFGASTGGTEAIKDVLMRLPADCPGIVITQHMPEGFTGSFALRLDNLCQIKVKEAAHGERILPGNAYIAPGHSHLLVKRLGNHFFCELSQQPPVNRHRPSVDVLFHSAAQHAKDNAVGIILTGMGRDGADGMRAMHDAGAYTFAQDEASCVVFGMPKEAIAYGGVDKIVPLSLMAGQIMAYLRKP